MMLLLVAALGGAILGVLTGLLPGLHPNAAAVLALGALPLLPFGPAPLAVGIVALTIAHQFIAAIPGSFLGAPSPEAGLQVLPAQQLLHEGRGVEAVELVSLGAATGMLVGTLLLLPLHWLAGPNGEGYAWLEPAVPLILVCVALVLLGTETARVPLWPALRAEAFPSPDAPRITGTLRRREGGGDVLLLEEGGRIHDPLGLWSDAQPGTQVHAQGAKVRVEGPGSAALGVALAALVFALATGLGLVAQRLATPSPFGLPASPMFPLLTGLFGMPSLLLALRSEPPPPQPVLPSTAPARGILAASLVGGACGMLVGILPGMSSSAASVLAMVVRRDARREEALVSLSAAGASAAVLTVGAFVLVQRSRSGAMLAVEELMPPQPWIGVLPPQLLVLLLLGCAAGAAVGFGGTLLAARILAPRFHRIPYRALTLGTLLGIVALTWALTGPWGLALLGTASLIGLLPWWWGLRRGHLMGCTMGPIILGTLR